MALPYSPEALAFRSDLVLAICNGGFGKHYDAADAFMASHVAPLLAALQQATAERDADRAEHARYRASAEEMWETAKRHGCQMLAEKRRADAAEAAEDDRFAVEYTTARGAMDYEHMARVLSGRLRRMDRRAAAANRRADAAEAALATATAEAASLRAEVAAEREAHAVSARERNRFASEAAAAVAEVEALNDALDDSQSLLATIHHIGPDRPFWEAEDLTTKIVEQIYENRTALARAATAGEGRSDG